AHLGRAMPTNSLRQVRKLRSRVADPFRTGLDQNRSELCKRGLPDGNLLIVVRSPPRRLAQRRVSLGEIGAVTLERAQVFLVGQRQNEIQIPASLGRRTAHQLEI